MAGMLDFCVRDCTYEYGLQNYVKNHSVCTDAWCTWLFIRWLWYIFQNISCWKITSGYYLVIGKGTVHPRTGHKVREGE